MGRALKTWLKNVQSVAVREAEAAVAMQNGKEEERPCWEKAAVEREKCERWRRGSTTEVWERERVRDRVNECERGVGVYVKRSSSKRDYLRRSKEDVTISNHPGSFFLSERNSLTLRQTKLFPKLWLRSWVFFFTLVLSGGWFYHVLPSQFYATMPGGKTSSY